MGYNPFANLIETVCKAGAGVGIYSEAHLVATKRYPVSTLGRERAVGYSCLLLYPKKT